MAAPRVKWIQVVRLRGSTRRGTTMRSSSRLAGGACFLPARQQPDSWRSRQGGVPHGGGMRLAKNSASITSCSTMGRPGMPVGAATTARLVGLRVSPQEREFRQGGSSRFWRRPFIRMGSLRDVSSAALYSGNAPHLAEVDSQGLIRCGQAPGDAAITVNYMGQVAAVQILSPRAGGRSPIQMAGSERDRSVRVDETAKDGPRSIGTGRRCHVFAACDARLPGNAARSRRSSRVSGQSVARTNARSGSIGCWREMNTPIIGL